MHTILGVLLSEQLFPGKFWIYLGDGNM